MMETRYIFLLSVAGILSLLIIVNAIVNRRKPGVEIARIRGNGPYVKSLLEGHQIVLSTEQFALVVTSSDIGDIMAYLPDPKPHVFDSYRAAFDHMVKDGSDDLEFYLVDCECNILAHKADDGKFTILVPRRDTPPEYLEKKN